MTTEDEMVIWHHQLNGPGFGWILGVCDGTKILASNDDPYLNPIIKSVIKQ